MRKFKLVDCWISITLIASFTILSLIRLDYSFLIGYCVVGGWQLVSMAVHHANRWFTHGKGKRSNYHITVAVIFILALVGVMINAVLWVVMVMLLFAAPLMAGYYAWLCYNEVYVKMQRPLAALR